MAAVVLNRHLMLGVKNLRGSLTCALQEKVMKLVNAQTTIQFISAETRGMPCRGE